MAPEVNIFRDKMSGFTLEDAIKYVSSFSPREFGCLWLYHDNGTQLAIMINGRLAAVGVVPCQAKPTREQIAAYSDRCKAERRRVDLVAQFGTDFAGLNLTGMDLRGVHTIRMETILTGVDFTGAVLRNVEFGAANLDGANFTGADLTGASFITASLRGADFRGTTLTDTRIYQSRLDRAKLSRADLSRADVTGSWFPGADLSHAILAGAKTDYWWTDFTGANLAGADLRGLKLAGARFGGADLRGAKLAGADLEQADFSGANLAGADLAGVRVEAADFREANGLPADEKARLVAEARRGAFEWGNAASAALRSAYWPGYLLVVAVQIGLAVAVHRRHGRSGLWLLCGVANSAALMPLAFLVLMFVSGSSPVAQFNAGSPNGYGLWSAWVSLWPMCLVGVPMGLVALTGGVVWFLARRGDRGPIRREKMRLTYAALTFVHLLLVSRLLIMSAPDA